MRRASLLGLLAILGGCQGVPPAQPSPPPQPSFPCEEVFGSREFITSLMPLCALTPAPDEVTRFIWVGPWQDNSTAFRLERHADMCLLQASRPHWEAYLSGSTTRVPLAECQTVAALLDSVGFFVDSTRAKGCVALDPDFFVLEAARAGGQYHRVRTCEPENSIVGAVGDRLWALAPPGFPMGSAAYHQVHLMRACFWIPRSGLTRACS